MVTKFKKELPVTLYEDNQSTILIAEEEPQRERTKHIELRFKFIKERIENNELYLDYLNTDDMIADMFTKPSNQQRMSMLI